jgi:hypothetical protein
MNYTEKTFFYLDKCGDYWYLPVLLVIGSILVECYTKR